MVLVLALGAAALAAPMPSREPPPLPDLLGDEPSDGTAAGMSAPAPPAVEPTDADRALIESLRHSAEQDPAAAEKLADLYMSGLKVERDLKQAAQHLRDAIRLKSTTAPNKLGVLLANGGPGLLRDPIEALARLREGALAGDPKALYNLAQQYRTGDLVERDEAEAFRLFKAAKDAPVSEDKRIYDAYTNLGVMLMEGLGTPPDPAGAVAVWREAVAHDNVRACYFLGLALARGKGVARDVPEALKWLNKARSREFMPALNALKELGAP